MRLYRPKNCAVWYYDFTLPGQPRLRGSTGETQKRQAELKANEVIQKVRDISAPISVGELLEKERQEKLQHDVEKLLEAAGANAHKMAQLQEMVMNLTECSARLLRAWLNAQGADGNAIVKKALTGEV